MQPRSIRPAYCTDRPSDIRKNPEFSSLSHLLTTLFDNVMKRALRAAPKKASMSYRRHRHPRLWREGKRS
jgi:hypothetical protein